MKYQWYNNRLKLTKTALCEPERLDARISLLFKFNVQCDAGFGSLA